MNGVFRWLIRFVPLVFYRLGLVRLWVLLPLKFRRHIVRLVTDTGERRSLDRPSEAGPPYVICGLASSTTSFGWALRATDQYLRAQGTKPTLIDLSSHFWAGGREKENRQAGEGEDLTGKGTAILHVNPNQFSFLKSVVQRDLLAKKYLVGYCFGNWKSYRPTGCRIWTWWMSIGCQRVLLGMHSFVQAFHNQLGSSHPSYPYQKECVPIENVSGLLMTAFTYSRRSTCALAWCVRMS